MRRSSLILGLSVALVAGCAAPGAQPSAELAAAAEVWEELFNTGDVDGLTNLYSENARFLPPNGEMRQGHDAIRADMQALMDTGLAIDLATVEAIAAGDLGYRIGTFTLSTPDGYVADRGKYIEVWRQIGGEWKIAGDAYNSDLAAGPAGTLAMATHEVGDADVWMAAWMASDARREQFAANGIASVRVFQDPENPARTGLLLDVTDMGAFEAFLGSEAGVAAAAEDTVKMDTLLMLQEAR